MPAHKSLTARGGLHRPCPAEILVCQNARLPLDNYQVLIYNVIMNNTLNDNSRSEAMKTYEILSKKSFQIAQAEVEVTLPGTGIFDNAPLDSDFKNILNSMEMLELPFEVKTARIIDSGWMVFHQEENTWTMKFNIQFESEAI